MFLYHHYQILLNLYSRNVQLKIYQSMIISIFFKIVSLITTMNYIILLHQWYYHIYVQLDLLFKPMSVIWTLPILMMLNLHHCYHLYGYQCQLQNFIIFVFGSSDAPVSKLSYNNIRLDFHTTLLVFHFLDLQYLVQSIVILSLCTLRLHDSINLNLLLL